MVVAEALPVAPTSAIVLGVPVAAASLAECAALVVRWALEPTPSGGPRYVCATSVHGLIEGWRDPEFRVILQRAALVTADGMPLVWVGRLRGRHMRRVYGPDLMLAVCRQSAATGVRHFFYGGVPGVAKRLAEQLPRRCAGLMVAGWHSPPFRELSQSELDAVADQINASGADVVWVGLSTPKQERWVAGVQARLRAKVAVTVGAAFDFHTGRLPQAPPALQRAGLEWAYRLAQEPRRLWRRYLTNNPLFVLLAGAELLGLVRFGNSTETEDRSAREG